MSRSESSRSSIRRELLFSVGLLFGAAVLVAVAAMAATLPFLESPLQVLFLVAIIVAASLVILFLFLRRLLARTLFEPLERIGDHAERISRGEFHKGIPPEEGEELDRLVRSLNAMAKRLIRDQELLAENVRSLDATNRELVATSEELARAARMASVGTLAAGVAHEVGNPLGALMASLDLARKRSQRGDDPAEAIDAARDEAGRIDRIVRSILEFARPGAGESEPTEVALSGVLERIVTLLEGRGALEGVELEWEVAPDTPAIRARPQHLEQVLLNLVMNALKAVEGGPEGRIRVHAERATGRRPAFPARRAEDPPGLDYRHRRRVPALLEGAPAVEPDAPWALIRVEDNGPGIPDEHLSRIFDPFFTTRDPGRGTGMGLALTARIVQELGGTIDAGNRDDGGARFLLRFPGALDTETVEEGTEGTPAAASSEGGEGGGGP